MKHTQAIRSKAYALLIEDAPNTPGVRKRFYEEYYCENGALAKDALVGKAILAARYAAMFGPSEQEPVLQGLRSMPSDETDWHLRWLQKHWGGGQ